MIKQKVDMAVSSGKKSKYKINFYRAEKIAITNLKCGNCGIMEEKMYQAKYTINEYDEFARKNVDKTKTTKVCSKCKWYIQNVIRVSKLDYKQIAKDKEKYNIKDGKGK